MGWLWFMFLIFAVLSNLMEKTAKRQRPSDLPRKDQGGGSRLPRPVAFPPFFWEEEKKAEPVPVKEGKTAMETAGAFPPERSPQEKREHSPAPPVEQGQKSWKDGFDQVDLDGFALQEMTGFTETLPLEGGQPAVPFEAENLQEGIGHDEFLSAIVLAQVLARPDFKTVPWQRRL